MNSKNLSEYITEENMLTCWGGKDDYEFKFESQKSSLTNGLNCSVIARNDTIITKDENDNTTFVNHEKKVGTMSSINIQIKSNVCATNLRIYCH